MALRFSSASRAKRHLQKLELRRSVLIKNEPQACAFFYRMYGLSQDFSTWRTCGTIHADFPGPDIRASRIILLAFHNAAFQKVGTLALEQTLATRASSFVHHDVPSHHSL